MHQGFNLTLEQGFFDNFYYYYYNLYKTKISADKKMVQDKLDNFILNDGSIHGTKLQEEWFPQTNSHIFISHSHKDEDIAITLAGWLYHHFKLISFIDSCIWCYAEDLLKIIDNQYCRNAPELYDYQKRNYSTAHVHLILNTALMKMIDKTECIFFLNTPNSITAKDTISNQTKSPWIYSELAMINIVRERKPDRYRYVEKSLRKIAESLEVSYELDLSNFKKIDEKILECWQRIYQIYQEKKETDALDALDVLYILPKISK